MSIAVHNSIPDNDKRLACEHVPIYILVTGCINLARRKTSLETHCTFLGNSGIYYIFKTCCI